MPNPNEVTTAQAARQAEIRLDHIQGLLELVRTEVTGVPEIVGSTELHQIRVSLREMLTKVMNLNHAAQDMQVEA